MFSVSKKFFCCHGGLSPNLSLSEIRKIQRPCPVPTSGIMCDLLWADPVDDIIGFASTSRGINWTFGNDVVSDFLQKNDFMIMFRAHQCVEGIRFSSTKRLVTIFSAPNYRGHKNRGKFK